MWLTIAAMLPIQMLWPMDTYPAAGVMATSPTTAPMHAPTAEGRRRRVASIMIQVSIAAAEAVLVGATAPAADAFAASADPALNPNHPNQSIPVPRST